MSPSAVIASGSQGRANAVPVARYQGRARGSKDEQGGDLGVSFPKTELRGYFGA